MQSWMCSRLFHLLTLRAVALTLDLRNRTSPLVRGPACVSMASSDPYLLFLEEQIRQRIEKKKQDNKNETQENSAGGWSPSTDYVLPYLEELRAIWINNQTTR